MEKKKYIYLKVNLNTIVTRDNYYDVCLLVNGEREDGRRNSVTLFRIPGDYSDNSIVNSQVTKNFILVTMHFCFLQLPQVTRS